MLARVEERCACVRRGRVRCLAYQYVVEPTSTLTWASSGSLALRERNTCSGLTGLAGLAHPELSLIFTESSSFGVFGTGLAAPLLNAQVLGSQQEAVEAQSKQALAQYQQAVLTAFREVEDALIAVRTARLQSDAQQQQVTALQSALKLAELRYRGELANYLDVLVARRSLFEAELAWTSTRRFHLTSIVQLYRALGGGWSPDMQSAEDAKKG